MKKNNTITLALVAGLVAVGAWTYTHSKPVVTKFYESNMLNMCMAAPRPDHADCLVGSVIVQDDAVACMQGRVFSLSVETFVDCTQESIRKLQEGI